MENKEKKVGLAFPIILVIVLIGLVVGGYFAINSKKTTEVASSAKTASIATVNGFPITKAVYEAQVANALTSYQAQGIIATTTEQLAIIKKQVLDNLISNQLLDAAVASSGTKVSADEINTQIQTIQKQSGGAEGFKVALAKNNLTEESLRENVAKQLGVQKFLLANIDSKSVTVSDTEVEQFYADYSKQQKAAGQKTIPTLKELSADIKLQITSNKQQVLANAYVESLRTKATIVINQ